MCRACFDVGKDRMTPNSGIWKKRQVPLFRHLTLNSCCGAVVPVPVRAEKSQVHDEAGRREISAKCEDFSDFCNHFYIHKYNRLAA